MTRARWLVCLPLLLTAARAEAKGCHERSEIVGKQRCSRFGDGWDVSERRAWIFGLGVSVAHVTVPGTRFHGSVSGARGDELPFSVSGDSFKDWTSIAASLRILVFPGRVFYAGIEGQAGGADVPSAHLTPTSDGPGRPVPWSSALGVHTTGGAIRSLGAVAGVSVPVWRFDFSLEVLGGFRALAPNLDWDNPNAYAVTGGCWTGSRGALTCPSIDTGYAFAPHVEPRAGLAFRFTPWVGLRALMGVDPMARGAPSVSTLLEIHARSYDGFYPRQRAGSE